MRSKNAFLTEKRAFNIDKCTTSNILQLKYQKNVLSEEHSFIFCLQDHAKQVLYTESVEIDDIAGDPMADDDEDENVPQGM